MPTLVLEGWDDATGAASMGVNYAIAMTPGNKAYYVQADATSFDAQMQELSLLRARCQRWVSLNSSVKSLLPSRLRLSASTKRKATLS